MPDPEIQSDYFPEKKSHEEVETVKSSIGIRHTLYYISILSKYDTTQWNTTELSFI